MGVVFVGGVCCTFCGSFLLVVFVAHFLLQLFCLVFSWWCLLHFYGCVIVFCLCSFYLLLFLLDVFYSPYLFCVFFYVVCCIFVVELCFHVLLMVSDDLFLLCHCHLLMVFTLFFVLFCINFRHLSFIL